MPGGRLELADATAWFMDTWVGFGDTKGELSTRLGITNAVALKRERERVSKLRIPWENYKIIILLFYVVFTQYMGCHHLFRVKASKSLDLLYNYIHYQKQLLHLQESK